VNAKNAKMHRMLLATSRIRKTAIEMSFASLLSILPVVASVGDGIKRNIFL
jgi:hypothetical protein